MSKQEKLVIGLVRTSGRSRDEDKESINRQTQQLKDYCKAQDLAPPKVLTDYATSGASANRKSIVELRQLVKDGQVSHVIFCSLDRLVRNVRVGLELVELFNKHNVIMVSLSENIDTSSSSGKFILNIWLSLAQMYSDILKEKMTNYVTFKKQKQEKVGRYLQYGYELGSNGKTLIPNDHEQQTIELIVDLKLAGNSYSKISDELLARSIPTRTGKEKWSTSTIKNIFDRHSPTIAA